MTPADPLLAWREQFPITQKTAYLVSHSLGAMPRATRERLAAYADAWDARGVQAWGDSWWEMPISVGNLLAKLLGAPESSVSMHQNVTLAEAIVLASFDWKPPRTRLVCSALDFPSLLYLYEGYRAFGAEIVRVPSDDGISVDPQRIADAVDERTAVVCFSKVVYRSGAIVDERPIVEKARRMGAITLVDAYQATGAVPLDVTAMGVDALTGGSVKWLCGGPGAGYLYVRPESRPALRPRLTGWMAHPSPFAFDPAPMTPVDGPFRYLNGTPSIPSLYAAQAGYETLLEIGVPAIREKSLRLTQLLLDGAAARGWKMWTPSEATRRGGTVSVGVPDAPRVCEELARREVIVDWRPEVGLRIGPHFYNSEEDVERALTEIESLVTVRR
jgi:kynureninase